MKIVNLGEEVFENVIVPTCLSFLKHRSPSDAYQFADLSKDSKFSGDFRAISFRQISLQRVKSSKDLSLYFGKELRDGQVPFADALEIKDAGIQYHRSGIGLKNKGGNDLYERLFSSDRRAFKNSEPVWYGRLMDKWFITSKTDEFFNLDYDRVLKANETASFSENTFKVSPKIIWRQTASCLRATIDMDRRWFRNTIQCAYIKDEFKEKIDVCYLLGIINSRFIAHAYNSLVKEAGRVFPQVKLTHVKKLPLAIAERADQKDIAQLVKRRIAAKQRDSEADVSALERELDQLVYALYALTAEEVRLVENSTK